MENKLYKREGTPLNSGDVLHLCPDINNYIEIRIEEFIGRGTTSFVYKGEIIEGAGMTGQKIIVKEFYPRYTSENQLFIRRDNGKVYIDDLSDAYKAYAGQFDTGYEKACQLAKSNCMEIVARPLLYINNETKTEDGYCIEKYVISETHMGEDLSKVEGDIVSLKDKLIIIERIIDTFMVLHSENMMLLDFKPENFLWIDDKHHIPPLIKLIDFDSIEAENDIASEEKVLYINSKYCSTYLKNFRERVSAGICDFAREVGWYKNKRENIFNIGMLMYRYVFGNSEYGEILTDDDLENFVSGFKNEKIVNELKQYFLDTYGRELNLVGLSENEKENMADDIICMIRRALVEERCSRSNYKNLTQFKKELSVCMKILQVTMPPRALVTKANMLYACYNMLQKNPLYKFMDGKKINVLLYGSHIIRTDMLKAIISVGQMLDTQLNIKIVDDNYKKYWESLCRDCPELNKAVACFFGEESYNSFSCNEIVDEPLANIYFYSESNADKALKDSNYLMIMNEDEGINSELIEKIVELKQTTKSKYFLGYIYDSKRSDFEDDKTEIYPMSLYQLSETYNEDIFKSEIFEMALKVHKRYTGTSENYQKLVEDFGNQFRKNPYNFESSVRSALHSYYKIASLQKKYDSLDVDNYEEAIKDSDTLERLIALEHRSWTAYMIMCGAKSVYDTDYFKSYVYKKTAKYENDWKNKANVTENAKGLEHPCLKSSRAGRVLNGISREKAYTLIDKNDESLDELDKWSIIIDKVLCEKAEYNSELISDAFSEIEKIMKDGKIESQLNKDFVALKNACKSLYDVKEGNNDFEKLQKIWKVRENSYIELCNIYDSNAAYKIRNIMKEVDFLLKPLFRTIAGIHDFKDDDEGMVKAVVDIVKRG